MSICRTYSSVMLDLSFLRSRNNSMTRPFPSCFYNNPVLRNIKTVLLLLCANNLINAYCQVQCSNISKIFGISFAFEIVLKTIAYNYINACVRDSVPPELILILKFEKKSIHIQKYSWITYVLNMWFYPFNVSCICTYNSFD
jgi:hypothetical protein